MYLQIWHAYVELRDCLGKAENININLNSSFSYKEVGITAVYYTT